MSELAKFNELVCEVFGVEESDLSDDATPDDIDDWNSSYQRTGSMEHSNPDE